MSNTGRPTSYTAAKAARIVAAIRKGVPYKLAAAAGGVSYSTFVRWRNDGSNPHGLFQFRKFCEHVRQAEAEAAMRHLDLIEKAAKKLNWQAAAWLLERRHPDLFGKDAIPPQRPLGEIEPSISDND